MLWALSNHGSITVVSRATYEHALVRIDRGVLGISILLIVLAAPVALNHWLRYRSHQVHEPKHGD